MLLKRLNNQYNYQRKFGTQFYPTYIQKHLTQYILPTTFAKYWVYLKEQVE